MTTAECHIKAGQSQVEELSRFPGVMFSGNRAAYIDASRGVLIVMMIIVHATIACTVPVRQQIQHLWLLDIATTGFTMLAGYTIGMRYAGVGGQPQVTRLFIRALQLLVVMFYSNLLLQIGKLLLEHQLLTTMSLSWLMGLFTLETPYNISGVLLPIALQLPLFPLLFRSECRWGSRIYIVWFTLVVALIFIGTQIAPETLVARKFYRLLWVEGLGGFPVLPFIGYGVLGFITARLLGQRILKGTATLGVSALISLGVAALAYQFAASVPVTFLKLERTVGSYAIAEFLFLAILAGGRVLTRMLEGEMSSAVPLALMTIGRYGLFAFVIHRIFGHWLVWTLGLKSGGYEMFLFLFVSILGLTYLSCFARMRWVVLDQVLVKLYL